MNNTETHNYNQLYNSIQQLDKMQKEFYYDGIGIESINIIINAKKQLEQVLVLCLNN
jgi:uncharacterized protein (DUF2235 family)